MRTKLPTNLKAVITMLQIPRAIYSVKEELFSVLHKGNFFDENKQFFWITNAGKNCVSISPQRFLNEQNSNISWQPLDSSRFSEAAIYTPTMFSRLQCHIKASILSLDTWYTASLVFKLGVPRDKKLINIIWKMKELSVSTTHYAKRISNDRYSIKMWQFINDMPDAADFKIVIHKLSDPESSSNSSSFLFEGFELQPLEMHDVFEEDRYEDDADDDEEEEEEYWEKKFPDDYSGVIQMSDEPLEYTTKKELYLLLFKGFLGHHGESRVWFSLCKSTLGICSMLPATDIIEWDYLNNRHMEDTIPLSESRFHEVIKPTTTNKLHFKCRLETPMYSPHHIYTCYLVFKLQANQTRANDTFVFKARCWLDGIEQHTMFVYSSNIPRIKPTNDYGSHDPSIIPRNERTGFRNLRNRKDGWMEVMLCKQLHYLDYHNSLKIALSYNMNRNFDDMIIEGIQFRPVI